MNTNRYSDEYQNPSSISFQEVLEAMLNESKPFHPRYLYRLSDLETPELELLEGAWSQVVTRRRQAILEDIESLGESNYTLSFEEFCRFTAQDSDPRVRELSIRVLWDYENPQLVPLYLNLLNNDSSPDVRATAAAALGRHVYLGELEELPQKTLDEVVDSLLQVYRSSEPQVVRCRALESLGYSSREEIANLIEYAYNSGSQDWIASSLIAMSRSAQNRWEPHILEMLASDVDEIRYEAVRAAGELELKKARPLLLKMLDERDSDMRMAVVWSLSQIGGEGVEDTLVQLYEETEDEDEADFIDLALDNLSFTDDMQLYSLFEYSSDENDEDDEVWDMFYDSDEDED